MVPSAVKNTQFLADWAKRKQWENNVVLVKYYEDAIDKIEHVQFRVKFNKGEGSTNVIIHTNYELSWHNVIQCNCGWTLMSGRPCIHAAFCLRFPNLDNKLPKDKYFAQYSCEQLWDEGRNYIGCTNGVNCKSFRRTGGWFHIDCIQMPLEEFQNHCKDQASDWFCMECE